LPGEGQALIVAGALISIAVNPLLLRAIEPAHRCILARSEGARLAERHEDPLAQLPVEIGPEDLTNHVVLIGYGRVGQRIARALRAERVPFVVAEWNRESVERLRSDGILAVSGDATEPDVLIQAHVARARILVIAVPDAPRARRMLDIARRLKPNIETVVRTATRRRSCCAARRRAASSRGSTSWRAA